ncbi:MAG: hypothetical protein AABX38_00830 [Candidatus Micrarchaeota archaeon]
MVELKKIKIEKKFYHFDVKKRYQKSNKYKLKQRTALDNFRSMLSAPKTKTQDTSKNLKPSSPLNFKIIGLFVLIAFLVGLGLTLYLSAQIAQITYVQPTILAPVGNLDAKILSSGVITSGSRIEDLNSGVVLLDLNYVGITNYSVNLTLYKQLLPNQIFILSTNKMEQADGYPVFFQTLKDELNKKGLSVSQVTIAQLESIPKGALIIVPTGVIPQELLGINSKATITSLIDRGDVIVYIGQPFNKMIGENGVVLTPQDIQNSFPIRFDESAVLKSTSDINLYPAYQVKDAVGYKSDLIYGSVSVVKSDSGGAILFLPSTLDAGWVDQEKRSAPSLAGKDVARVIYQTKWVDQEGDTKSYSGGFTNESQLTKSFFTNTFKADQRSVKIEINGFSAAGVDTVDRTLITSLSSSIAGDLYLEIDGGGFTTVPKVIGEENLRITARLKNPVSIEKSLYISITKDGKEISDKIPLGIINLQSDFTTSIPIDLDSGEYILSVVDEDETIYSQSILKVVFVDVAYFGQGGTKHKYYFQIQKDGQKTEINNVLVSIQGGKYGIYNFSKVSDIVIDTEKATNGEELASRSYDFAFTFGKIQPKIVKVSKVKSKPIWEEQPLFLVAGLISLLIVGIGVVFARKEQPVYLLDIPDFPPIAKTKIPIKTNEVIALFDSVNDAYRWKCTPLTLAEIKNGFKKIFHGGKPILITDYNTQFIIEDLIKKDLVSTSLEYYGLKSWESKTKTPMQYMAIFRKLRDIFVNNAIPFTQIGESENCDTTISIVGQNMYLHIYYNGGDAVLLLKNILSNIKLGLNIVVLKGEDEKNNFQNLLSSSNTGAMITKLEIENGTVQLMGIEEFEKMVVELKTI